MIGSHFFYATGHQATITSIKWEAAFVGFHGDFERYMYPVAAALIVMNMFASHILMILGLPLLLLWPLQRRHFYTSVIKDYKDKDVEVSDNKGEFNWCENGPALRASLLKLMLYYILVHGLRVSYFAMNYISISEINRKLATIYYINSVITCDF